MRVVYTRALVDIEMELSKVETIIDALQRAEIICNRHITGTEVGEDAYLPAILKMLKYEFIYVKKEADKELSD